MKKNTSSSKFSAFFTALAIALIVFSITASLSIPRTAEDPESKIQKELMELNQSNIPDIQTPEQVKQFEENEENNNQ